LPPLTRRGEVLKVVADVVRVLDGTDDAEKYFRIIWLFRKVAYLCIPLRNEGSS
jgi:hypothetical protein